MGCGQSHISIIYPRKSKNKDSKKRNGEGSENEENEKDGESDADSEEGLRANRLKQIVQASPGPLLAHTELSSSQSDFFKMLDEKIERGPDYDSNCEYEIAIEHARLCRLLHDWEMAKIRSRNKLVAPIRKTTKYNPHINGSLHKHRYPLANSVVMYDQRGGYYTELA